MDIAHLSPTTSAISVPAAEVARALDDARSPSPRFVHRSVALTVAAASEATARLRLARLARAVMATDRRVADPAEVWAADWTSLPVEGFEAIDRGIRNTWQAVSTQNAMRDALRSLLRQSLAAGMLTYDEALPRLNAIRPQKLPRDAEKQSRGHISSSTIAEVFAELAADESTTARRDTAAIALLLGAGLRRSEAAGADFDDLDEYMESLTVRGKGEVVRDVPLSVDVRRALRAWLKVRGRSPGPLLTPMSREVPRTPVLGRRLSAGAVALTVRRRFGPEVASHDLRRTFTGDLLDSGADLSVVSKILGHASPATTAGYDRRGRASRLAAVERMRLPISSD